MKNLGRWVLLVIFLVSVNLSAQKINPKQKEKIEATVTEMAEVMGLKDAVKTKLLELKMSEAKAIQEAKKATENDPEQRKASISALKKDTNNKIMKLVTKEKWVLWNQHVKKQG